ncbi:hypothetical protein H310_03203 [Aphanomyces invadans]|uniref:receptor protein-tyrosine kinase n=1 Tax=Aphanomyces invadans TaxID=157072 RepID=A0A024UIN0_9STRA|nr:hypothetical protein H310_03203 [Aphanomyces invadans]ETW05438.1 hypothetical protein H310_03203 [Aphanomyces invadans]|eukprot:XP_008865215.1 hypothetical protein H310_03203 [Aphanomyces invadans]
MLRLGVVLCAAGGALAEMLSFAPTIQNVSPRECSLSSIAATIAWPAVVPTDDVLDAYELSYRVVQNTTWISWSNSLTGRIGAVPSLEVQTVVSRGLSGPITGGYFRLTSSYLSIADVDTRTGLAVSPLIAFDASAADVRAALEAIHDIMHVQVTREGPDLLGGYAWRIEFHEEHARPMLGIHTNLLDNGSVSISQVDLPTSMCTTDCIATVTGLSANTNYVFRVRAHAATAGWGPWSPVTKPWTTCTLALPGMPTQVIATSVSPVGISVTWAAPSDATTSLPIRSYSFGHRCNDDIFWRTQIIPSNTPFAAVTTARPNANCQVRVLATNDVGSGQYSDVVSVRTLPGPPLPPLSAVLSSISESMLRISITPTMDDGGAQPVAYIAEIKTADGTDWIPLPTLSPVVGSAAVLTLDWQAPAPYTRYVARVSSKNSLGASDWVVSNFIRTDRPRVVAARKAADPRAIEMLVVPALTAGEAANRQDKYYMAGTANGGRLGGDGQPGAVYVRVFAMDGALLKQDAVYFTGSVQNYTIPDTPKYVRAVADVYAWGGGGGGGSINAHDGGFGGGGGFARAAFSITRGSVFQVTVGGGGGGATSRSGGSGGFGGGGRGGRGHFVGGGGGGATLIHIEKPRGQWTLVLVAAGGGGGGASSVCCAAGGAAGGVNGTAGMEPTAAQMGLPLSLANRDEFHSKFEFGDTRDFTGSAARDNNVEFGYAPGADFATLAGGGGGGRCASGGEAGRQSSYESAIQQVATFGQPFVGGIGGDGKKGGGGGGGGFFGGGGGGGGLEGAGGGGGSGYISASEVEPLPDPVQAPVPQQVTITSGVTTLSIQWRPPENGPFTHRHQNVGYIVEVASGYANEDFVPVDGTTNTQFVLSGLTPATSYAIRIKLLVPGDLGGYSSRVVAQTLPRPTNSWQHIRPTLLMQSNVGGGFRHADGAFGSPSPRRGHTMVVLGEYTYLFGGFGPGYRCQRGTSDVCMASPLENNELWRYHSTTQTWYVSISATLHVQDVVGGVRPPPREKHSASALGDGKMLVFGGRQLAGPRAFNDVWQLDVGTTTTLASTQTTPNVALVDGQDTWTAAMASIDPTRMCIRSMQVVLNITHACLNTLEVFLYGPGPTTLPSLQQDYMTGSDVVGDVMWTIDGGNQPNGPIRASSAVPTTRGHRVQLYGAANASMACRSGPQTLVFNSTTSLEPMDAFSHLPAAGTWTLQIHDREKDSLAGTLTSWGIEWIMEPCTPSYEWTNVGGSIHGTPPSPRYQHTSIAVGPTTLFVFGGKDTVEYPDDLYRLDFYSSTSSRNAWQVLQPVGLSSFHRRYGQLFFVTPFQALVPTAGLREELDTPPIEDQLQALDMMQYALTEPTSAMQPLQAMNTTTSAPSQRYFTSGGWWTLPTSPSSKVVLFGGQDQTGFLDDLWELSLAESPPPSVSPDYICPWMMRTRAAEWSISCGATSLPSQPCSVSSILQAAWCQGSYQTIQNLF